MDYQEEVELVEMETQDNAPEEDQDTQETQEGEVEILVGDEQPEEVEPDEEAAPAWIKDVRQKSRDVKKENQDLKRQLREMQVKVDAPIAQPELGVKPTLEGHDWDSEAYSASLENWMSRKQEQDQRKVADERVQQGIQMQWQQKLSQYDEKKAKLRVSGFADAEAVAQESLHPVQLGIIIQGAEDPAKVIYAIGKNDERAKALAKITDPVQFAFAVSKLEASLKTTTKTAPPPSTIPKGSGSKVGSNATLDKLRDEASRTGDMSKVMEYKRKMAPK